MDARLHGNLKRRKEFWDRGILRETEEIEGKMAARGERPASQSEAKKGREFAGPILLLQKTPVQSLGEAS